LLGGVPGIEFMPEAENIEARSVWKPIK